MDRVTTSRLRSSVADRPAWRWATTSVSRIVGSSNLVWKDTVLVRTGETVDILLDVTNPGRWMAHCHIAEHHESGMMFSFDVAP
jgi:FtsP/CotA-like multicopper oxidase with cupredoxin domain